MNMLLLPVCFSPACEPIKRFLSPLDSLPACLPIAITPLVEPPDGLLVLVALYPALLPINTKLSRP